MKQRLALISLAITACIAAGAERREIKPGFNLFSKQQDIQLGKEAAAQIEKQVTVVGDQDLQSYISQLGRRLARVSQDPEYPYTFKVVAAKGINAFALPGGPIYVHAETIAQADNEAQLAGVVAHEIAHVALRHGTNQVSKAQALQIPALLAGGLLGNSGSLLGSLAQLGIGVGLNSIMLKYSRDAERDADLVGARMMAAAGFDPVEMARFFEKLEQQGGGGGIQFLSDHPNPGNRVKYVQEEVQAMSRATLSKGSESFGRMRSLAANVKVEPRPRAAGPTEGVGVYPSSPSDFREHRGTGFRLLHPAVWTPYPSENGMTVTIAPRQGLVRDGRGQAHVGLGAIAGYYSPNSANVTSATDELLQDLRARNPELRPVRGQRRRVRLDGAAGEAVLLIGPSSLGNQREAVTVVTALRPEGLFYLILIGPESEYDRLRSVFQQMQASVRFR